MKLAVIGSRNLSLDLGQFMERVGQVDLMISGGARGIDRCAEKYAWENGIPMRIIKPDYESFGRAAPLIRDRQIVAEADLVLAIWDGTSRGTSYTVRYARKLNKQVILFQPSQNSDPAAHREEDR